MTDPRTVAMIRVPCCPLLPAVVRLNYVRTTHTPSLTTGYRSTPPPSPHAVGALSPSTSHRASVSEDDLKHELRQLGIIRSPSSADPTDGRRSGGLSDVVDAPVGLAHADMRGSLDGHNVSVEDVEGSLTQYNISVQYEETAGAPGGGGPASQRMVFGEESESEYDVQGEGGSAEVPEYSVEDYEGSLSQANLGMDYEESLRDL